MEFIIGLILLYLFIRFVLPLLIAAGGVAFAGVFAFAVIFATGSALVNYVKAIHREMNFVNWTWEKDDEPAKRSYFFGPNYAQLFATIKTAFALNHLSRYKISDIADTIEGVDDGFIALLRKIAAWMFKIVGYVCVYWAGMVLSLGIGLIHGLTTTAVMIVIYVIFTITWLIDRIYLWKNKIRSDCPVCHSRFTVPVFMCPECGAMHRKLVPGPYGIWRHKCECGAKLPATFLNGRSSLDAFCPECGTELVASNARPIVLQLIGGSKSGKTVFLSAFFHEFLEKLEENSNCAVSIRDEYQPYFEELEDWYQGTDVPATAQLNSQMYPILVDSSLGVRRQFSIYDIAGEMFDGNTADSEIEQQQFSYCDGLLLLLDPFSSGNLRKNRIRNGESISDFSDMPIEDVVNNFINYLVQTGRMKVNTRCQIPTSVIIAKADVKEIKREIGPAKIYATMKNQPELYPTYEAARDDLCKQFLINNGLSAAVDNLETQFANIHYFPVSSIGHSPDGTAYEPWGISETVEWILPLADKNFSDLINPQLSEAK